MGRGRHTRHFRNLAFADQGRSIRLGPALRDFCDHIAAGAHHQLAEFFPSSLKVESRRGKARRSW